MKRCHCGSEMIPLFNFFACKAECDLPPSMRTKVKAVAKPAAANVSLSFNATSAPPSAPWTPAVGDWVRVLDPGYGGVVYKVTHRTGGGYWAGTDVVRGVMYQFSARYLEPWAPRVGENAKIRTGQLAGYTAFVVNRHSNGWNDVKVGAVSYCVADADLEPAP